jgi:hypothetical protein
LFEFLQYEESFILFIIPVIHTAAGTLAEGELAFAEPRVTHIFLIIGILPVWFR